MSPMPAGNYLISEPADRSVPVSRSRCRDSRRYVQTGIVLQVGATPTINAVLGVGTLEESVTVEAAAPLVDVRSAGISDVVEQRAHRRVAAAGTPGDRPARLAGAAVQHRRRSAPAASPAA